MVNQEHILSDALKMNNLYFEYVHFKAYGVHAGKERPGRIGFKADHRIDEGAIAVKLFCRVEVEDIFDLELCLVGEFEAGVNIESERVLPNAIAIMFPYLRAQVSLMTAQPNIPTINLKPVNINALLKKQKEKEQLQHEE